MNLNRDLFGRFIGIRDDHLCIDHAGSFRVNLRSKTVSRSARELSAVLDAAHGRHLFVQQHLDILTDRFILPRHAILRTMHVRIQRIRVCRIPAVAQIRRRIFRRFRQVVTLAALKDVTRHPPMNILRQVLGIAKRQPDTAVRCRFTAEAIVSPLAGEALVER